MKHSVAEEIMVPLDSYPHVPYWFSLRQAIGSMAKAHLEIDNRMSLPRVVLVFDEQYQLMGLLRRRDILRGLGRNALQDTTEHAGETDPTLMRDRTKVTYSNEELPEQLRERADRPVSEVMTPIRISVPASMPISDLIDYMVYNDVAVIPVIKENSVVGIVRSTDVLHHVGQLLM